MREHDVEREMDAALSRYAAVEPRHGLEQRVLANLRAQRTRATRFTWARLSAAGLAVAASASLLIWIGEGHWGVVNVKPAIVQHETRESAGAISAAAAKKELAVVGALGHSQRKSSLKRADRRHADIARANAEAVPSLAQFPAPAPLSEQENLLLQYVEQNPHDAVLVAEAMNLESQRELDEMKALNKDMRSQQEQ